MDSFANLIKKTEIAFDQSDIKQLAEQQGEEWFYSISSTKLIKGTTLIIGFNWGAGLGENYSPQSSIPSDSFRELYERRELGSLQRIYAPLTEYFPSEEVSSYIQTNFCFFRSKTEDQISNRDLELSLPLFSELLEILAPKRIIGLSAKLKAHFIDSRICSSLEELNIDSNGRTLHVSKGYYGTKMKNIPIYFLPHPNAKFTSIARKKAWDFCFNLPASI